MPETYSTNRDHEDEVWKQPLDFIGYEVSTRGRARSYWQVDNSGHGYRPFLGDESRILDLHEGPTGHLYATFRNEDGPVNHQLGYWMLLAFVGKPEPGQECRHLDDDPKNNALENLCWGTRRENVLDRLRNGRHNMARLSVGQVKDIKRLLRLGVQGKEIASQFSISPSIISNIKTGKIWAFVEP